LFGLFGANLANLAGKYPGSSTPRLRLPMLKLGAMKQSDAIFGFVVILLFVAIYIFPAIVARIRWHRSAGRILRFNIFFGWTLIGWFGALIWAMRAPSFRRVSIKDSAPN
jgi:hypothetical protein